MAGIRERWPKTRIGANQSSVYVPESNASPIAVKRSQPRSGPQQPHPPSRRRDVPFRRGNVNKTEGLRRSLRSNIVIVLVLAGSMLSACGDQSNPLNPQARAPAGPASRMIMYQFYQCEGPAPENGGIDYSCYDASGLYYDSLLSVGMEQFCQDNVDECMFYETGFPTPFTNPAFNYPSVGEVDVSSMTARPDCGVAQSDSGAKAWCGGAAPTGLQNTRINNAISAMQGLGGYCSTLASTLAAVAARGDIHIYPSSIAQFSGAAPPGGGSTGVNSWIAIKSFWTDEAFNSFHATASPPEPVSRDLQQILAHEADHLMGQKSASGGWHTDQATFSTPHSETCSGI
ncbi:MAG: hypothetical protein JWM41_2031 [Gemmatimonadetes bacterium]|nr:hypothetical protein [Gemmatimonadota bacterium]